MNDGHLNDNYDTFLFAIVKSMRCLSGLSDQSILSESAPPPRAVIVDPTVVVGESELEPDCLPVSCPSSTGPVEDPSALTPCNCAATGLDPRLRGASQPQPQPATFSALSRYHARGLTHVRFISHSLPNIIVVVVLVDRLDRSWPCVSLGSPGSQSAR